MKFKSKANTIPSPTVILNYEEIYKTPPPENHLSLISTVGKVNLIVELSALNYRLKPYDAKYWDTSIDAQIRELEYFCRLNTWLCMSYVKLFERLKQTKSKYPLIFTRQTCIYAMEEIVQSNLDVNEDFKMTSAQNWQSIFDYILSVNAHITKYDESENKQFSFENINPQLLPLNELNVSIDQLYTPVRGYKLLQFLSAHSNVNEEVEKYFLHTYSSSSDFFFYELIRMHISNRHENPLFNFYHLIPEEYQTFYEVLSQKYDSAEIPKLLSIKKYPYYKTRDNQYVMVDNLLLIEKTYSQLINDFWFDWLKGLKDENGNVRFNIINFKGVIGKFFEAYVEEILQYAFANTNKYFITKYLNELKIGKKEIEISDVYIRYNNKVIIGEVKATSIYDKEKFGGTIDSLYKKNREKFFENFGVDQVARSIQNMNENIPLVDEKFSHLKRYVVFPIVIVDEKAMQTPLMAALMQDRFAELMKDYKPHKVDIYPLSTIHISDLETIQDMLHKSPNEI